MTHETSIWIAGIAIGWAVGDTVSFAVRSYQRRKVMKTLEWLSDFEVPRFPSGPFIAPKPKRRDFRQ